MSLDLAITTAEGHRFEDGADRGRILVSSVQTDGQYSMMEWIVAAGENLPDSAPRSYGAHLHRGCEETFLVRHGTLEFLIGEEVVVLQAGDLVRVPPGTRHGYMNTSGAEVDLIVTFIPGGFEELFLKYRTDQEGEPQGDGFLADASRLHCSEFEV